MRGLRHRLVLPLKAADLIGAQCHQNNQLRGGVLSLMPIHPPTPPHHLLRSPSRLPPSLPHFAAPASPASPSMVWLNSVERCNCYGRLLQCQQQQQQQQQFGVNLDLQERGTLAPCHWISFHSLRKIIGESLSFSYKLAVSFFCK